MTRVAQRSRGIQRRLALLGLLQAGAWARAEVRVTVRPPVQSMEAGGQCDLLVEDTEPPPGGCLRRWREWLEPPWSWRILNGQRVLPGGEGGVIRDLGSGRFRYTAPRVERACELVLRATRTRDPGIGGQVAIQVRPPAPWTVPGLGPDLMAIIHDYCPESLDAPLAAHLPFRDIATGLRFRTVRVETWGMGRLEQDWDHGIGGSRIMAGFGMPLRLRWPARFGAAGQMLSFQTPSRGEGAEVLRLDATGADSIQVRLSEHVHACALESLAPMERTPDGWASHHWEGQIRVRGLVLVAGSPVAAPAPLGEDGLGVSARFSSPLGLARVAPAGAATPDELPTLVVAEPLCHVLRGVTPRGRAKTLWGRPGHPGHRDGAMEQSLFNGPSFVACRECPGPGWDPDDGLFETGLTGAFVVSDSGNHAIRQVAEDGSVSPLAGSPHEGPGHRDHGDPSQALFHTPQGIAVDLEGHVYVADQGNGVIRRIAPGGAVTTLAGMSGRPGTDDGLGPDARFLQVRGLALDHRDGNLYVTDSHAVRRITPQGRVTTILGCGDAAGFQDRPRPAEAPFRAPCCRNPCGIVVAGDSLYIADQGNHAIREYRLPDWTLRTLAGDPGQPAIRWGLLRDGLEECPGEPYGALLAPRGLARDSGSGGEESLFLATGSCLARITAFAPPESARPKVRLEALGPLAIGQGYQVAFSVPGRNPFGRYSGHDFEFEVAFRDPDGTAVGPPVQGAGGFSAPQRIEGRPFTMRGTGRVLVRCVTLDGISGSAKATAEVR